MQPEAKESDWIGNPNYTLIYPPEFEHMPLQLQAVFRKGSQAYLHDSALEQEKQNNPYNRQAYRTAWELGYDFQQNTLAAVTELLRGNTKTSRRVTVGNATIVLD